MKCPRCHVDVPMAAACCPGCRLPKPKSTTAKLKDSKQKSKGVTGRQGPGGKRGAKPEREIPKWANVTAGIVSALLVVSLGIYVYWFFVNRASDPDPHEVQPAMQ